MTTQVKAPAPKQTVAEQANAAIAAAKTGPDPMRPVRYGWAFVRGTVRDTLDGLAHEANRGGKMGLITGVIAGIIAGSGVGLLFVAVGFFGGAAAGAARGLLTGGKKEMGRMHRGEKYAEDLLQRRHVQRGRSRSRFDIDAEVQAREAQEEARVLQILERERENRSDMGLNYSRDDSYWQDKISESRTNPRELGI